MSRGAWIASVASSECNEPQCLCASPLRLRMKTSQSGVFGVAIVLLLFRGLRELTCFPLLGIRRRGLTHPSAVIMRLAPRREAIAIARPVAGQHLVELGPVDRAVAPVPFRRLRH